MKLTENEIKELQELNLQMGISLGMIEAGIQVKLHAEKYAAAFARTGEILSKNFIDEPVNYQKCQKVNRSTRV